MDCSFQKTPSQIILSTQRDIVIVMIFTGDDRSACSFISCVQWRVLKKLFIVAQKRELCHSFSTLSSEIHAANDFKLLHQLLVFVDVVSTEFVYIDLMECNLLFL